MLGWAAQPDDSFGTKKLRTTVITALLAYNDKAAIAEAQKIFANYLVTKEGLNPDFRSAVFQVHIVFIVFFSVQSTDFRLYSFPW